MRSPFFGRSVSGRRRRIWSIEALENRDMMSTISPIVSCRPPLDPPRMPPIVWNPPHFGVGNSIHVGPIAPPHIGPIAPPVG
jgi:hypothetical protein